jgi:hypothetical protein
MPNSPFPNNTPSLPSQRRLAKIIELIQTASPPARGRDGPLQCRDIWTCFPTRNSVAGLDGTPSRYSWCSRTRLIERDSNQR